MLKKLFGISVFLGIACVSTPAFAFLLNDVMSKQQQERTGIYNLNHNQRMEIEKWLNETFVLKPDACLPTPEKELTLAENINNGRMLKLSDGSVYEIAPGDINRASGWITPFPLQIVSSGDYAYPYRIVNKNTGASLKAKLISTGD